ncbi:hypothetical protein E4T48_02281 [Aureobasidium sp. EXF-10727]|nr:hypothetical protein E4T48_02281 [Aureobasidium sp. EXF-10727]KAI4731122.1 hypothetical protein E4T49_01044 [Aureobasidium sp. EXF-10728]
MLLSTNTRSLHYVSRPNLANNLMGATLRQATVLGLHREYIDSGPVYGSAAHNATSADVRRRTWWSLYVLDTWANTTTGRPSLGQPHKGITVRVPCVRDISGPATAKFLPLVHNIDFCRIASQIQDSLSATPLLPFEELNRFDKELLEWHTDLPASLKPSISSAVDHHRAKRTTHTKILETPSVIMHWRYQNLRLLLHRPYLLATALRNGNESSLSAEEKVGIGRCQAIAAQTISDISDMCREDLLEGWNGVWFMYQAVMVPLVCIFSSLGKSQVSQTDNGHNIETTGSPTTDVGPEDRSSRPRTESHEWQTQVEKALDFFEKMNRWSAAAKKSRDVVSRLYEASKILASDTNILAAHTRTDNTVTNTLDPSTTTQTHQTVHDNAQTTMPTSDTMTNDIWGLSPNGAAAINNFWFDDMMWDVPIALDTDIFENTGNGFELDWLTGFNDGQSGGHLWQSQQ